MIFSIYLLITFVLTTLVFITKNNPLNSIFRILFIGIQLVLNALAFLHKGQTDSIYFKFDSLGIILSLVLVVLTLFTFFHSSIYLNRHKTSPQKNRLYYVLLMLLISAMNAAYFANHLTVMWISIEATTIFVAALIYHEKTKVALEASWKYLFVSSVGVAIAFAGILILSALSAEKGIHTLNFDKLLLISESMNPKWLKITFILVLTGFSAKMGIVPFYTVTVDAHTAAPSPISAFISTTLMNVGFLGIFRVYTLLAHSGNQHWVNSVLLLTGVLSISLSAIQLLRIKHFKRMFAFSSLEHMGIIILAVSLGKAGMYAALLHVIFHSFVKAGLFYQIGQVHSFFHSYWIKDAGSYFKLNPVGGLAILLGFLSITAMPPSGLFVSEFLVFKALFANHQIFVAVLILLLLSIIIYVFGKQLMFLLFSTKKSISDFENIKINRYEPISQFLLFGLVIYLGINPPAFLTDLINETINLLN